MASMNRKVGLICEVGEASAVNDDSGSYSLRPSLRERRRRLRVVLAAAAEVFVMALAAASLRKSRPRAIERIYLSSSWRKLAAAACGMAAKPYKD
jgi:hypothetical protein